MFFFFFFSFNKSDALIQQPQMLSLIGKVKIGQLSLPKPSTKWQKTTPQYKVPLYVDLDYITQFQQLELPSCHIDVHISSLLSTFRTSHSCWLKSWDWMFTLDLHFNYSKAPEHLQLLIELVITTVLSTALLKVKSEHWRKSQFYM